jgi:hypothetical protein
VRLLFIRASFFRAIVLKLRLQAGPRAPSQSDASGAGADCASVCAATGANADTPLRWIVGHSLDVRFVPKRTFCYAACGCLKVASNWASAQSISSLVITSGGLTRMVWSWVSLHSTPRRRRASQ